MNQTENGKQSRKRASAQTTKTKRGLHRSVDIAMTVVIILLLSSQVTGQTAHEWIGIAMAFLVIVHIILNRRWYKNLFKGKYKGLRILQTIVNLALLVCFVVTAISGMVMSEKAVPFLRQGQLVSRARELHLGFSHWTFVLVSAHLGLHWGMIFRRVQKKKMFWIILSVAGVIAAGYGLHLTIRAQLLDYMLFRVQYAFLDYQKAPLLVILENIFMMGAWILIFYEISRLLQTKDRSRTDRSWNSFGMIAAEFLLAFLFSFLPG